MQDKQTFRCVLAMVQLPYLNLPTKISNFEQLGVEYVAGALRAENYPVEIVDDVIGSRLNNQVIIQQIVHSEPKLLGFSPTFATMERIIDLSQKIKDQYPDTHIVVGGHHATPIAETLLKEQECFDSVVRGEGEKTIVELADRLRLDVSLKGCAGLVFRRNGEIIQNPDRTGIQDLDSVAWPVRDALFRQNSTVARVISSRGCYHQCIYCTIPQWCKLLGKPYRRFRSVDDIIAEIQFLISHGITKIMFMDDDVFGHSPEEHERFREIALTIIRRGWNIRWGNGQGQQGLELYGYCRADCFKKEEFDLLRLLKLSGLRSVLVGVEAGAPSVLKRWHKGGSVNRNAEGIKLFRQAGIFPFLGYIMFDPYSTFEELRQNAQFLYETQNACFIGYFWARVLEVHPGTEIEQILENDGLLEEKTYVGDQLYRFQESHMEPLAHKALEIQREEHHGHIHEFDTRLAGLWMDYLNEAPGDPARQTFEQLCNELGQVNLQFFLTSVDLAEKDWNEKTFESIYQKWLEKAEPIRTQMIQMAK